MLVTKMGLTGMTHKQFFLYLDGISAITKKNIYFKNYLFIFIYQFYYSRTGVKVMCLCPSVTNTPILNGCTQAMILDEFLQNDNLYLYICTKLTKYKN